jgi:C1A family cysteine protease
MTFLVLVLTSPGPLQSVAGDQPTKAPLNPEFISYLEARAQGAAAAALTPDGHLLGLIPSRHLIPNEAYRPPSRLTSASIPSFYDLRDQGKLTPIRNQGGCGSCWAFAAFGSLESYLLPAEATDYSENDLIQNSGFDLGPCVGGNLDMAMAYLARWGGPINEADNPYPYSYNTVEGAALVRKHVQDVAYLPFRVTVADDLPLREAVMTSGAVYIGMRWCSLAYNATHHSFYNDGSYPIDGGHAVCVVGWNDDYPASNFNKTAPGNGAYIVRNSWGPSWGENGYFYVSYYDESFGICRYGVVTSEATNNYSSVYQYDPLGWVDSWGYEGSSAAWAANIFTAAFDAPVAAVSFYAASAGTSYALYLYTNVISGKPRSGSLQVSTSGTMTYAGYCTIDLPASVPLSTGQKFSVVIKLTTPDYRWPIPTEDCEPGWSGSATSSPGQSFIDPSGSVGTTWQDISASSSKSNICLKAFTAPGSGPGTITVTCPVLGNIWYRGGTYPILWTSVGVPAANVAIQLMRGSTQVKSIANPAANDGAYSWKVPNGLAARSDYFIRVRTTNGQVKGDSDLFSVSGPSLTVTSPSSGEIWYPGETRTIAWNVMGTVAPKVTIQLLRGSTVVKTVAQGIPNSGSYIWKIPVSLSPRNYCLKIKTTDGAATGTSAEFWIDAPTMTILSPAAGVVWPRGSSQTILWETEGPRNPVKIILRRNGAKVRDISTGTANDWSFDWLIPLDLAAGGGYDIKITTTDGAIKGVSSKFSLS